MSRLLAALGAALLLLTACANTSSPVNRRPHAGVATASTVNGIQEITIEATDNDRFIPSTFYVHPGKVRVTLVHTGTGAPHNFEVTKDPADFVPDVYSQGQRGSDTFIAPEPGRYQFICTIHVEEGQIGTMVVLPK
jgi:plastocyanin